MKLTELRVNHIEEPMGFQICPLSFSWKIEDPGKAKKQEWARLQILCDGNVIFDSGEDKEADSLDYEIDLKLTPRTYYEWNVEVVADNGDRAFASSCFETGKMDEAWQGRWITPDMDADISPILKKTFYVKDIQNDKNSRLYICGLGIYEAYINGKKVWY